MKHYICFLLPFTLLLTGLTACTEEEAPAEPQLVIEGWIEDNEYPVVFFGQTLPLESCTPEKISDYVVRWGKITLSDGEENVVLTGGFDKKNFIPYKYTTYRMKGQAGKTYTLTAEYQGRRVTATTTVPPPVVIDSIRAIRCDNDTLYYIKVFFKDNPDERNRYALFSQRVGADQNFLLSFWGVLTDDAMHGPTAVNVYRGNDFYTSLDSEASVYFKKGDVVNVRLSQIDEASYRFWTSYANLKNFSSNLFFPYARNLESNIIGGKGYWCGYGSYTCTLRIQ